MGIRQASADDLEACSAISATVQITHVWQLRLAYDPIAPQMSEELGATLHRSRLPRSITVQPANPEPLAELWERATDILVAEDTRGIAGYVVLVASDHSAMVQIARLVVAPLARRAGLGGSLLRSAQQWGAAYRLGLLTAHCGARNDAAASFYMRWGFRFAGYSEAFYPRGEIALFFQRQL